jgi:hypothetical protein
MSNGIMIAIVTFSPQTTLIRNALRVQFPDLADDIIIRGNDNSWEYDGVQNLQGKQPYIASAAQELTAKTEKEINKNSTVLIDDDINNIRYALQSQSLAMHFNPTYVTDTITTFLHTFSANLSIEQKDYLSLV